MTLQAQAPTKAPETRAAPGELRATGDDGIIEGYAAVWNTVDDYNSSFQRGCFAKTIQERGTRVKVLWDHEELIGKPLELREDDHGLFVRAQLVLSVARAREVFDMVKAGVVDTFSFAFRTVKDKWVDGTRIITEAMLKEVSPVAFEANSAAKITGVRSMPNVNEKRSQDYQVTYAQHELGNRGSLILGALFRTLDDVWWSGLEGEELTGLISETLEQFGAMYTLYAADMVAARQREQRGTAVQCEMRKFLSQSQQTPEQLAATTPLTLAEVRSLLDGTPCVDPAKAEAALPESVRVALQADRTSKVEALFAELRAGFLPAELSRLRGLLPQEGEAPHAATLSAVSSMIAELRLNFKR